MKKRVLFLALIGVMSIASLTSCGEQNITDTVITDDNTNDNNYKIEDNELSQMVYNEFLKSYPNLTYDDFRLNGKVISGDSISFRYAESYIYVKNNAFDSKKIVIDRKETYSKYINNEWIIIEFNDYEQNTKCQYYLYDSGSYELKVEYTYDENGNELTQTASDYVNGKWVFNFKFESTYDENGNILTKTLSYYKNNTWFFYYKYEITYDENGNRLTETKYDYVDGEWVYSSKSENTYDENGNQLTMIYLKYKNDVFVGSLKFEFTYDDNGNRLTETYSKYENDTWVYEQKIEYTYDENGNQLTEKYYDYVDGEWVSRS